MHVHISIDAFEWNKLSVSSQIFVLAMPLMAGSKEKK